MVLAVALVAAAAVFGVLRGRDETPDTAVATPTPSTSPSSSPTRSPAAAQPTSAGMKSFIRGYIAAVSSDPDTSWKMLTPRFQRESGGLATYRDFWDGVGPGRILELSADPRTLVVSYRVRFANFGNGQQTTVLDLVFDDGTYLIDGER